MVSWSNLCVLTQFERNRVSWWKRNGAWNAVTHSDVQFGQGCATRSFKLVSLLSLFSLGDSVGRLRCRRGRFLGGSGKSGSDSPSDKSTTLETGMA